MMSELEIHGLVKRFGTQVIIDGLSFHVKEDEFFVLVGPSGGGKTTLLRLICGLEQPDRGRIMLRRHDITDLTPRQRNIGMIFQDYGLYPHMDVYNNIAYGLEVRGFRRDEIARRVRTAVETLEIAPLIRRSITTLSGGEQQRVALARVLVKDANIYLYDEPLANLDPKLRQRARRDIIKIHRAKGRPTIYVTHDLAEAFALGDRVAVIANQRLQQIGTPEQLINTPENLFVARFAGTPPMNLFPAQLHWSDGKYTAWSGTFSLPLSQRWTRYLKHYDYPDVIVGLKPAALVPEWLFEQVESAPLTVVAAEVLTIEPLFAEVVMTVKIGAQTELTSVFQESEGWLPRVGEIIQFGIYDQSLCLFDPTTEKALKPWFD